MRAREAMLASSLFGDDLEKVLPIVREGLSDSACLDSVLELLVQSGRSLPHAVMMLVPEAWEHHDTMSEEKKAFYAYHSCLVEPWDGPACVTFTDGVQIGAVLDRNGLRPARYWVTADDYVILASEVGVLDVPSNQVIEKGRLQPGKMFLVDLAEGRIIADEEIKHRIATEKPYQEWVSQHLVPLEALQPAETPAPHTGESLRTLQHAFGYTQEDLKVLMAPMALKGEEPIGSMGNDAAIAVLSRRARPLPDYFQQLFAQVTNPPLDAIREKLVTSVGTAIGPERNLLDPQPESCRMILCESPFLDNSQMARFKALQRYDRAGRLLPTSRDDQPFYVTVLDMVFPVADGPDGMEPAIRAMFAKADTAIANGAKVLVLSDRGVTAKKCPIPALLAVAGLQNHLVRARTRTRVTLIVETADAREVHHFATLIGYGASAVNPWLALESLAQLKDMGLAEPDVDDAYLQGKYLKAVEKGVVKVMSKMGISTVASYRGAQIFEAVGLSKELVDRYFTNTPSRIGGIGMKEIAQEALLNHARAWTPAPLVERELVPGGQYQWRRDGELHLFNPETVFKLQHATRAKRYDIFRDYTKTVDDQGREQATLRGLFTLRTGTRPAVPLEEVEPVEAIVKRFATGAMSFGSISAEAHETLAIAMNRIGGRSNSGEGGEDPHRFTPDAERRLAPQRDQAGGVGPLRRHEPLPRECRRAADQDGAGRQARRGWPAARQQGVPVDCQGAVLHAGRRPHQPAAAPRHLLDRGPRAADLRPAQRQPACPHQREARGRGRRRHRRGGRRQGQERPDPDQRPRRRHGRQPVDLAQARGRAVGARPRRDAADARGQPPPRPRHGAGRRPDEDRPRRRHRRAARGRGIRLRDGAAGRDGLRDDARLPPRHVPGRHRDAEPDAAGEVHRPGRSRRQLLPLHRGGSARADGAARLPHACRTWSAGPTCSTCSRRWITGRREASTSPASSTPRTCSAPRARRRRCCTAPSSSTWISARCSTPS